MAVADRFLEGVEGGVIQTVDLASQFQVNMCALFLQIPYRVYGFRVFRDRFKLLQHSISSRRFLFHWMYCFRSILLGFLLLSKLFFRHADAVLFGSEGARPV